VRAQKPVSTLSDLERRRTFARARRTPLMARATATLNCEPLSNCEP
jgi:hypothetical protein